MKQSSSSQYTNAKLSLTFLTMDIFVFILVAVCMHQVSADENRTMDEPVQLNSAQNPNIVTIDLRQCFCTLKDSCDLTIIKSSLSEVNCENGEQFCCPMIKPFADTGLSKTTESPSDETKTTPKNVRIYSIYASSVKDSSDQVTPPKPKPKRKCTCKARGTCPHKNIDYGFGFHCSYSMVRCCIPEDYPTIDSEKVALDSKSPETEPVASQDQQIEQPDLDSAKEGNTITEDKQEPENSEDVPANLQQENNHADEKENRDELDDLTLESLNSQSSEGELLITEVTSWNDDFQKDSECFCLPMEKCVAIAKYETNSIERRRDTLCPADLVQCCGNDMNEEITKKKDDSEYDIPHIKQDFPPYQQPIQLPSANLPTLNESDANVQMTEKEATLPPPVLPTQYHSYEPVSYHRGNVYSPNAYPSHLSGPQPYQKGVYDTRGQNIRPWVNLASPSSYSKYQPTNTRNQYNHGYPRGPYPDDGSSRSTKPGGLFDTLAQMLG